MILMNLPLYSYPSAQGHPAPHPHFLHTADACFLSVVPNQVTFAFLSYSWAAFLLLFISKSQRLKDKTCNQPDHHLKAKCWFSVPGRLHLKSWLHLVATYSLYLDSESGRRLHLLIYKGNNSYNTNHAEC